MFLALGLLLSACGSRTSLPDGAARDATLDPVDDSDPDCVPVTVSTWRCGTVEPSSASCVDLCQADVSRCASDADCALASFRHDADGGTGLVAVLRAREETVRRHIASTCGEPITPAEPSCMSVPECSPRAAPHCVDGACEVVDETTCRF